MPNYTSQSDFYNVLSNASNEVNTLYSNMFADERGLSYDEQKRMDALEQQLKGITDASVADHRDSVLKAIQYNKIYSELQHIDEHVRNTLAQERLTPGSHAVLEELKQRVRFLPIDENTDSFLVNHAYDLSDKIYEGRKRFEREQAEDRARENAEIQRAKQLKTPAPPPEKNTGFIGNLNNYLNKGVDYVKAHPWQVGIPAAALSALGLGALYYGSTNKKKKKKKD